MNKNPFFLGMSTQGEGLTSDPLTNDNSNNNKQNTCPGVKRRILLLKEWIKGGNHLGCVPGVVCPEGFSMGCFSFGCFFVSALGCTSLPITCLDKQIPPANRMTHRCKNITLPQTLFVGGKN